MTEVRDNEAESRFELDVGGTTAFASYRRQGRLITFTHTVVPEALEGQGIGTRLIAGALEMVRSDGLKAVPVCAFVRHYFDTHPETRDLLESSADK